MCFKCKNPTCNDCFTVSINTNCGCKGEHSNIHQGTTIPESNTKPCSSKCDDECNDYIGTNCSLWDGPDIEIAGIPIKKNEKLTSIIFKLLYKLESLES